MKTTTMIATLGAVLSAFTLTACDSAALTSKTAKSPSSATTQVLSPAEQKMAATQRVELMLESEGIDLPPGFVAEYAEEVCTGLRRGDSSQLLLLEQYSDAIEINIEEHAMIFGLVVGSHCPQYAARVESEW